MNRTGLARYQEMDVISMSPPRRVVFLYAHLLANLRQGRQSLSVGDIEQRSERLSRAMDVVHELLSALDPKASVELTNQLTSLYAYFMQRILYIDVKQDVAALDQLIEMISQLHSAWESAASQLEEASGSSMPA